MESEPGRSQQQSNQNSYLISRSVEAPNSLAPDDSLFQSLEPFLNSDFWQLEYQRGKKLTELPKRAVPIERELPNGHVQSMQPVNQTNGGSNNNFFSRREPTNQRSKKPRPLSYQGQFDHLFPMKLEENIDKCDYSDSKSFTKPSTYDVMSQSYYQPTNNRHYATLNPRFPQKNQITSEFSQCMSQSYHPEYYDNVDLEQFSSPPLDYRSVKTQKNEQKMENFNQNGQLIETYDNWPVSDPQSVTSPEKVQKSQQQMPNEPGGLSNCNQNGYLNQIGQNSHDDHWPFNNSSQQNQSPRKSQLKQSPNYRSLADLSGRTTPTIVEMGPVRKPEAVGVWNPPLRMFSLSVLLSLSFCGLNHGGEMNQKMSIYNV